MLSLLIWPVIWVMVFRAAIAQYTGNYVKSGFLMLSVVGLLMILNLLHLQHVEISSNLIWLITIAKLGIIYAIFKNLKGELEDIFYTFRLIIVVYALITLIIVFGGTAIELTKQ